MFANGDNVIHVYLGIKWAADWNNLYTSMVIH